MREHVAGVIVCGANVGGSVGWVAEPKHGWQKLPARRVHEHRVARVVWPNLTDPERAWWRSQERSSHQQRPDGIPNISDRPATFPRVVVPSCPTSSSTYRCGRLLDCRGHHRAACAEAGVLGARGFALERAAAQVCREGGGRVSTNVMVRNLDIESGDPVDARRLEWLRGWRNLLSCTAVRALATSLLERRTSPGVTSAVPAEHEVLRESRFF